MNRRSEIREFVVAEFLPDVTPDELPYDEDLIGSGVLDSLSVYVVLAWLGKRYGLDAADGALTPAQFRTVDLIDTYIRARTPIS